MPITAQQFERTYNAIQTGNAIVEKRKDGKDWITITIETSQETTFDWLVTQGMALLGAGKYASPLSIFLSIMSPTEMGTATLPKNDFILKPQEKIVMRGDALIKRLFPVPPKFSAKSASNTYSITDSLKKQAAQKQINDLQAHHKKGLEFIKKNEFENAIRQFNLVLTLSANYQPTLVQRGICYLHLKNYSKSILDLEKAKQLEKTNYGVYYHLSLAYFRSNQVQKASENISQALRILPGNPTYLSVQKQIRDTHNVSHKPKPNNTQHVSTKNISSKVPKPVLTIQQKAVKKSEKREQAYEISKRLNEQNSQRQREEDDRKRREQERERRRDNRRRMEEETRKRREENLMQRSEQQRRAQQEEKRCRGAQKPIKTFLIDYLKYQERHGNPLNGQGLFNRNLSRACAQNWNDVAKGIPICVSKSYTLKR